MAIEKVKEDLWVRKGVFGWSIVYPIKKDVDKPFRFGNINWKHLLFGSTLNLIQTTIFIGILLLLVYGYQKDTETCREIMANPCQYSYIVTGIPIGQDINISGFVSSLEWADNKGEGGKGDTEQDNT